MAQITNSGFFLVLAIIFICAVPVLIFKSSMKKNRVNKTVHEEIKITHEEIKKPPELENKQTQEKVEIKTTHDAKNDKNIDLLSLMERIRNLESGSTQKPKSTTKKGGKLCVWTRCV